jgi:hypothetical protein
MKDSIKREFTKLKVLNLKTWDDIYSYLADIPNDKNYKTAGLVFELFAKEYFLSQGNYSDVWLTSELPASIKKTLNVFSDIGVDIVLRDKHNNLS